MTPSAIPDSMPRTTTELWERWLGYRLPHYGAMEAAAARTLNGSRYAVVRVGWDGARGVAQEWHVTLFTLAAETPDAEATVAAIAEHKPAGMLLHHVSTEAPVLEATTPPNPRAAPLARQVSEAVAARLRFEKLAADSRARRSVVELARREVDVQAADARVAVEEAIVAGLETRRGSLLVPVAVIKMDMLANWVLYQCATGVHSLLAGDEATPWVPEGIAVCRACTLVFRPRRRGTASFCQLCRRRPAPAHVFGERALVPGELQTVRTPQLAGNVITGWRSTAMGLCGECGEWFIARRDAKACPKCTGGARQRRHRSRRAAE